MWQSLALDVIDRILTHIDDIDTLKSIICVSRRTAAVYRAHPNSILTIVCQNEAGAAWPSVARFVLFKRTRLLAETEDQAVEAMTPLERKDVMTYLQSGYSVQELAERFFSRYAPHKAGASVYQCVIVRCALYRIWLYQARFGGAWERWFDSTSHKPAPDLEARREYVDKFSNHERMEFTIIYRWLMSEIGKFSTLPGYTSQFPERHAQLYISRELPDISEVLCFWLSSFQLSRRIILTKMNQFFPDALPYRTPVSITDCLEEHILGDDCIYKKPCDRCNTTGTMKWNEKNWSVAGGFWGTPEDFVDEFLDTELRDMREFRQPLVDAMERLDYGIDEIFCDVLELAGYSAVQMHEQWICTGCISGMLHEWLTFCWIKNLPQVLDSSEDENTLASPPPSAGVAWSIVRYLVRKHESSVSSNQL
ncbi:hypothetical protein EVG20_g8497 [Dentipellis fragilis]|uniref:F-box domain-containing protein n=1 Tax=Dentipellis fragilis TaxID=205917 RepID=A0A4Y9Y7Z9_9AGAM|nr:hypothetical protein EVG20_g8497 [Dentipellis fragilis]